MTEYVDLYFKRNRGWPSPEDSWGLTPMFGADGWCHSCGVPKRTQIGSLVVQKRSMQVKGAWVPNWRYDAICVDAPLADAVVTRFDIDLRKIDWQPSAAEEAYQIVVPSIGDSWFAANELRDKAIKRHGTPGATCSDCGVWRWMPLVWGSLPSLQLTPPLNGVDIAASPEWFGDGFKSFRQILVRRELAELIAAASPRDFEVHEIV